MLFANFFLPKYLHMSKKSSTFAADLERKPNKSKQTLLVTFTLLTTYAFYILVIIIYLQMKSGTKIQQNFNINK